MRLFYKLTDHGLCLVFIFWSYVYLINNTLVESFTLFQSINSTLLSVTFCFVHLRLYKSESRQILLLFVVAEHVVLCVCQNPVTSQNTSVVPTRERETEGRNLNHVRKRDLESRDLQSDLQTLVHSEQNFYRT